jgi:hypothetical protein
VTVFMVMMVAMAAVTCMFVVTVRHAETDRRIVSNFDSFWLVSSSKNMRFGRIDLSKT